MTMQDVLTDLADAQRALQQSGIAFDAAIEGIQQTLAAIRQANHAQGDAITAVIAATEKALQLTATRGEH